MKCTNKVRRICFCMSLILCMSLLTGCGNVAYTFPYDVNSSVSSFNVLAGTGAGRAEPFAADLCVVTENQTGDGSVDMSQASAAVLFDVNNKKVLYSKNAHERLYPASLTKVMTALVALQNASPDTVLTAPGSDLPYRKHRCPHCRSWLYLCLPYSIQRPYGTVPPLLS